MNVRATNRVSICQFVFLYRTPDQFQRIKAEEETVENEATRERISSPLFEPEDTQPVSPADHVRDSSTEIYDDSTIVVSSPVCVEKTIPSSDTARLTAEATLDRISKTQAAYMAKSAALKSKRISQEAEFLSLDSDWHDSILDLEAKLEEQKAEDDKMLQAKRDRYEALQLKIAGQKRQLEEDMRTLDEEIQYSEDVSTALSAFANKRAKLAEE